MKRSRRAEGIAARSRPRCSWHLPCSHHAAQAHAAAAAQPRARARWRCRRPARAHSSPRSRKARPAAAQAADRPRPAQGWSCPRRGAPVQQRRQRIASIESAGVSSTLHSADPCTKPEDRAAGRRTGSVSLLVQVYIQSCTQIAPAARLRSAERVGAGFGRGWSGWRTGVSPGSGERARACPGIGIAAETVKPGSQIIDRSAAAAPSTVTDIAALAASTSKIGAVTSSLGEPAGAVADRRGARASICRRR